MFDRFRRKTRNAPPTGQRPALGRKVILYKSERSLAYEAINPIAGLSISQAQAIFDQARRGCYARLHYIFSEIERADPTLFVCVERRAAAIAELDWKVVRSDVRRHRAADQTLADEQIAFLEGAIADCTNLPEAVEHLALAFFRGFAAAQPNYKENSLKSFDLPDSWNLCWDRQRNIWQWNPDASTIMPGDSSGLTDIPAGELLWVRRRQFIDYPAMAVYIRSALGESDWGRFLERYGVPPATIIMPEFTDRSEEDKFLQAAQDVANAGSGALPYGSLIEYATEARNADPFTGFLEHQQKLIVLMATGGLATSLETAQGLGSGTSEAHKDSWRSIVRRDSRVIANAINRQICERLLASAYPDQPMLAEFAFENEPPPDSAAVFSDATAARAAGNTIAQEDLQQLTGYTLIPYEQPSAGMGGFPPPPMGAPDPRPTPDQAVEPTQDGEADGKTPREPVANPLQNARRGADGKTCTLNAQTRQNASDAVLRDLTQSLAADLSPVAERVAALIAIEDPAERQAQAQALIAKLPDLLPDDPEMAAIMETEIAEAFASTAGKD